MLRECFCVLEVTVKCNISHTKCVKPLSFLIRNFVLDVPALRKAAMVAEERE